MLTLPIRETSTQSVNLACRSVVALRKPVENFRGKSGGGEDRVEGVKKKGGGSDRCHTPHGVTF